MNIGELKLSFYSYLADVIQTKEKRNVVILTILIIILSSYAYSLWMNWGEIPQVRMLVCGSETCKKKEVREFYRISDERCSACNKKDMKYALKCNKCDYEFGYLPSEIPKTLKTREGVFKFRQEEMKCPNCSSIETGYMLIE